MDMAQLVAHLETAQRAVDEIAIETIQALAGQDREQSRIEAAGCLTCGGVHLFGVAHDIASGKPTDGHGEPMGPKAGALAVSLRLAEIKMAEAKWRLDPEMAGDFAAVLRDAVAT